MSFLGFIYWVVLVVCIVFGGIGATTPNSPLIRYWGWPLIVLALIVGITLYSGSFAHGLH